ncbi:MAG: response regulator transcription factor [Cyanobacteria bacterium J06635_10]
MKEQLEPVTQKFLIVDDHEAILEGTVPALQTKYPWTEIFTAKDSQTAQKLVQQCHPDLVVVDLSLPRSPGDSAKVEVGMQLLENLMQSNDAPNIVVLSTNVKPLVRIKCIVNTYEGGFAAMDKSVPFKEMLNLVDIAQRGSIYLPREVRSRPEFDRKWLEVLTLKYEEGLSDKAIAKQMSITDRTVRNYWIRIQDALGVFDSPDKDLRIQIEIAARKAGLIN